MRGEFVVSWGVTPSQTRHASNAAAETRPPADPTATAAIHNPQGITTAIAYQHGMGSSAFALAVALSSIVMYDAAGVRRHAGEDEGGGRCAGGWHRVENRCFS